MRSLVYFFPPRTSVTDSVGISTRPILSCSPKACTRDSRDSRTLRSNPEYEWMMYHFMLGLRGASGVPLPGALPAASGCPPAFFSSSAISCFISRTFCPARSAVPQGTEHEVDAAPDHKVDQPEIQAENKDRDDHHDRGGLHLFQRGRGHLLHLGADVVVEGLDLLRPGGDSPSQIVAGSAAAIDFVIFFVSIPMRHTCFLLLPKTGRGGGIRTPKSGFGDRQFNR